MNKILTIVIVAVVLLSVAACQKRKFPVGKIEEPKNAPEYTVTPDLTKN